MAHASTGNRSRRGCHALTVGDRAHRIAGSLLAEGPLPTDRLTRATAILETGREVLANHPADRRPRAVLAEACGAVATYLHYFNLASPWEFTATEFPVSEGRVDLVFRNNNRLLIDELKFGLSRHLMSAVLPQVRRYVAAGEELWGDRFIGVRVCTVAEPLSSRLYRPGSSRFERLEDAAALRLEGLYE